MTGTGSLRFFHAALFDTGFLTGETTQIVQFGTTHLTILVDCDRLDKGRFHGEDTLNADTIRNFAYSETLLILVAAYADYYAAELLDTLLVTLFDAVSYSDGVAGAECGDVLLGSGKGLLHYFNQIHFNLLR